VIRVNDEAVDCRPETTVADLLERLDYRSKTVAVWIDGEMVPREAYKRTTVPDGADVQIVHAVVGG
jgi:sulfur carrier protein